MKRGLTSIPSEYEVRPLESRSTCPLSVAAWRDSRRQTPSMPHRHADLKLEATQSNAPEIGDADEKGRPKAAWRVSRAGGAREQGAYCEAADAGIAAEGDDALTPSIDGSGDAMGVGGIAEAASEAAGATTAAGSVTAEVAEEIGSSGTISSATMLMILISGFTAGPAVSL